MSIQRIFIQIVLLTVIFLLLPWQPVYAGKWVKATNSGCWIWDLLPVPNKSITYTGNCFSGLADGMGILTYYVDGKKTYTYSGQFKDGRAHGKGSSIVYIDGKKKSSRYTGQFKDDYMDGPGQFTKYHDGKRRYLTSGRWKHGEPDGMFKETYFLSPQCYIKTKLKYKDGTAIEPFMITIYKDGKKNLTRKVSEKEFEKIVQKYERLHDEKSRGDEAKLKSNHTDKNLTSVNGRDKLSQKWSFKSEPVWSVFGNGDMLPYLIPG